MDDAIIRKINKATRPRNRDNVYSGHYADDIFLIEVPEGGGIDEAGVVGFTGWPSTLKNEPTKTVRFYAKVVAFEDTENPDRNWNTEKERVEVPAADMTDFIKKRYA